VNLYHRPGTESTRLLARFFSSGPLKKGFYSNAPIASLMPSATGRSMDERQRRRGPTVEQDNGAAATGVEKFRIKMVKTRFAAILQIICKLTKLQHLFGLEIRQFARIHEF
jgi:hypothetical protein